MMNRIAALAAPARRAAHPWRTLARGSLSAKVVASLVLAVILACALVAMATYTVIYRSLLANLDQQLTAATGRAYAACLEHNGQQPPGQEHETGYLSRAAGGRPDAGHPGAGRDNSRSGDGDNDPGCGVITGQAAGTFGVRLKNGVFGTPEVVSRSGKPALSAADKATLAILPVYPDSWKRGGSGRGGSGEGPAPPIPSFSPPAYTRDLTSLGGDYRLTAVRGEDGDVLFTGLPLSGVENTLRDVETAEAVVFVVVVLLVGGIGTWLVRMSLRPLRRVAGTATMVTRLPLDTGDVTLTLRVPDDDPRTEVGQLGAAFNRMLQHVESALARRAESETRLRRFAADASHELRTPLAAIRGYAELALRNREPVPEAVTHALRRVESESARMGVLVDELLLLARLDAGRPLAREPVDLTRLAIDATSDARAASPSHRWKLELPDEPLMVRGDEHRLHQVLANLLANAAKHTPAGSAVTVAMAPVGMAAADGSEADGARGDRAAGDRAVASRPAAARGTRGRGGVPAGPAPRPAVQVSVTDDGPGIPPELLPELFERFARGDSSRSHSGPAQGTGSTGLGLAIVKAVVEAHHGSVSVTSRPGRTSFIITLPRLQEPAGPGDVPAAGLPHLAPAD